MNPVVVSYHKYFGLPQNKVITITPSNKVILPSQYIPLYSTFL